MEDGNEGRESAGGNQRSTRVARLNIVAVNMHLSAAAHKTCIHVLGRQDHTLHFVCLKHF